ncbi:SDR family oxidoreductase [Ideonella livida]|uniref:SDR family oxidoreductase n=1 Tax=Ideonella livida TaxID=2707176 RepID=A0A7C9PKC1_9BURK|nr:SDR family oxidoreductase [Ideonella livida]NDY93134.1 SDR family oxidoreductase [Ideonella livida]
MQTFEGRTAVITGAASGFGLALAREGARRGMKLVLADVQEQAAQRVATELAGQGAEVLALGVDVSSATAMQGLVDATLARFGVPHLVFNNAGVTCGGFIWEHTLAQWEWLLGINLMGVVHGVRLFTPLMLAEAARDPAYEGHLVNSASMAGLLSLPNVGAYTVSKHAVVALSETLYQDLALVSERVRASVLCPYSVPTGIAASQARWAAGQGGEGEGVAAATPSQRVAAALTELSVAKGRVTAEEIAAKVFAAVAERQFYIYSHPQALGTVATRMQDIVQGRNPSDPFAEKPALREQLLQALRDAAP